MECDILFLYLCIAHDFTYFHVNDMVVKNGILKEWEYQTYFFIVPKHKNEVYIHITIDRKTWYMWIVYYYGSHNQIEKKNIIESTFLDSRLWFYNEDTNKNRCECAAYYKVYIIQILAWHTCYIHSFDSFVYSFNQFLA